MKQASAVSASSTAWARRPEELPPKPARSPWWLNITAMVSGLLAFVFFIATPFLPVKQTQSSFEWPQNGSLNSVNAPLISLAPEWIELTVPISAADQLYPDQSTIVSTLPGDSTEATDRGLFINAPDGGLTVSSLSEVIFELTPEEVAELPEDATLTVAVKEDGLTAEVQGTDHKEKTEEDLRPQVTGIYSELDDAAAQELIDAGLTAEVEINSRFTSSPSVWKLLAMVFGSLSALVALWAVARMDLLDRRRISVLRPGWRTFRPLDGIVLGILLFWHFFGANTSDDGFILTMARVSNDSDYMANYYRWYGVPEAPFGSPYYDILAALTKVSTASAWVRLPTLVSGILVWWILSREILPRLGERIARHRIGYWTAAFMFLAFWLPYNNGVRPESVIALGTIATWASFESAIASRRLLPAVMGTIFAAFTLACGPTGLTAVGVFLICLPHLFRIMMERRAIAPLAAYVFPFLGAGTAVMVPVFRDQTLATVMESTSVRSQVGPALEWFNEYVRYSTLFEQAVDGSMTRRFAMFTMLFCLGLTLWAMSRYGEISGANAGPTKRLLAIFGVSMFFLMFTPTKWTHHFGIYAGLAGAVAALGAVVLAQIAARSARARTFSLAAVMFLLAISLAGWNAWWYVSSFGVPWWDRTVQLKGIEANTVMLGICLITIVVGVFQSLQHNRRRAEAEEAGLVEEFDAAQAADGSRFARLMTAPIGVACILMVAFSCLTFAKSFVDQAPAYSVGMGNVRSLAGNSCQLSSDVLLETDTNDSFLTPAGGVPLGKSLESGTVRGFNPQGVPAYIESENDKIANVGVSRREPSTSNDAAQTTDDGANSDQQNTDADTATQKAADGDDVTSDSAQSTSRTETQGNRTGGEIGVNGSTVRLPFNLDYTRIPVLGSFDESAQAAAEIKTAWFELPDATDDAPLLVTSVAGRIKHHDINGVEKRGQDLKLQYGTRADDGSVTDIGEVEMLDPGPAVKWRNLRYPIADLPEEANVVRLAGEDINLDPYEWMAVTPLRNPSLEHITDTFDSETPGLLDWSVALQFPCHRTFNHYAGVAEIPQFRISPDAPGKEQLSGFQDFIGGGALATAEAVNTAYEIPGYLDKDWQRDWGSAYKYLLRTNSQGIEPDPAEIKREVISRSGTWSSSHMKIRDPHEKQD